MGHTARTGERHVQRVDPDRFNASFTIDSPEGQVSGTKELLTPGTGSCTQPSGPGTPIAFAAEAVVRYTASIETAEGTFRDSGQAAVSMVVPSCFVADAPCGSFVENFTLSEGVLPLSLSGKATGGGRVGNALDGAGITFGFDARNPEAGRPDARCLVIDHETGAQIRCLDLTDYVQVGTVATFSGNATVRTADGQVTATFYRIQAEDLDESGIGKDSFFIETASGYARGGVLDAGNIQVHAP